MVRELHREQAPVPLSSPARLLRLRPDRIRRPMFRAVQRNAPAMPTPGAAGAEPALRPSPRDRALQKRSDRILLRGQPEVLQRSLPRTDLPWRALLSDCEELDSVAARARSRLLVATPVATMRGD